jgi:hypothetical protein
MPSRRQVPGACCEQSTRPSFFFPLRFGRDGARARVAPRLARNAAVRRDPRNDEGPVADATRPVSRSRERPRERVDYSRLRARRRAGGRGGQRASALGHGVDAGAADAEARGGLRLDGREALVGDGDRRASRAAPRDAGVTARAARIRLRVVRREDVVVASLCFPGVALLPMAPRPPAPPLADSTTTVSKRTGLRTRAAPKLAPPPFPAVPASPGHPPAPPPRTRGAVVTPNSICTRLCGGGLAVATVSSRADVTVGPGGSVARDVALVPELSTRARGAVHAVRSLPASTAPRARRASPPECATHSGARRGAVEDAARASAALRSRP